MSRRVVGIGGVFIRPRTDAATLRKWYTDHLGIDAMSPHGTMFQAPDNEADRKTAITTWSIFDADTTYFPIGQSVMINYRVEDLDRLLAQLKSEGVKVDEKTETFAFGKFGWIYDPDGAKIELWQPAARPAAAAAAETANETESKPDADVAQATKKHKQ
jgi:predicted enzyme related to lactoylglutathione lyase